MKYASRSRRSAGLAGGGGSVHPVAQQKARLLESALT
jgi:hypothetical protein